MLQCLKLVQWKAQGSTYKPVACLYTAHTSQESKELPAWLYLCLDYQAAPSILCSQGPLSCGTWQPLNQLFFEEPVASSLCCDDGGGWFIQNVGNWLQQWPDDLLAESPDTVRGCSQHTVAAAGLTSQWPDSVIPHPKLLLCWEYTGKIQSHFKNW